jgi:uncharacterized protein YjgD (DUF1641 family)
MTSNIVLPKLTSINCFYWSKRMKPIFISKDLWEFIIDGYVMPSNEEYKALGATEKKNLKELIKKDNEALCLLGNTVDESIFPRIDATKYSKQAWTIFKNTDEGEVIAKLETLRSKFKNANTQSNESVNDYITKIQDLINQMRTLGEEVSEKRMIDKILRSLVP